MGRLLHNLSQLSPDAAIIVAAAVGRLDNITLEKALASEKDGKRMERLALLLGALERLNLSAARDFAGTLSNTTTSSFALAEPLYGFQFVLFHLSMIEPGLGSKWLASISDKELSDKVIKYDGVEQIVWTVWNALKLDPVRSTRWLSELWKDHTFVARYSDAELISKLAMAGLCHCVFGSVPVRVHESSEAVATSLDSTISPELSFLAALGAVYGRKKELADETVRLMRWSQFEAKLEKFGWKWSAPSYQAIVERKLAELKDFVNLTLNSTGSG